MTEKLIDNKAFIEALEKAIDNACSVGKPDHTLYFFSRVVELQKQNPKDSKYIAYAMANFFDRHLKGSEDLDAFFIKCTPSEQQAYKDLANYADPLANIVSECAGRRQFFKKILAGGIATGAIAGILAARSDNESANRTNPHTKKILTTISLAGASSAVVATIVLIKDFLTIYKVPREQLAQVGDPNLLDRLASNLLADTNILLEKATELHTQQGKNTQSR